VLVVISALPEEGKSTFACNYARVAACGGKTLLIDGDLYNASATKAFKVAGPGLWEVLRGQTSLQSALKQSSEGALCVLGARDLSASQPRNQDFPEAELGQLIDDCRKHFDLVVIDCPAVLSSVDGAMPFIKCADGAILLIRWEKTDREAVTEALATLGAHARRILGVVLSMVPVDWYRLFDNGRYRNYYADAASAASEIRAVGAITAPAPISINVASREPEAARRAKSTGFRL
jgi:capsular exopolysaccharide synthesis family protein